MAKVKSLMDNGASKQQGLFDTGLVEGSFDIVLGLKQMLSRDLRGFVRYLMAECS